MVYPQGYRGEVNAVAPPIIALTLGNMYEKRSCFIENMTFSVDENTPWEIGMNRKLYKGVIIPPPFGKASNLGYSKAVDETLTGKDFILPMIIDVDITLKFIESKSTVYDSSIEYGNKLYDYILPARPTP